MDPLLKDVRSRPRRPARFSASYRIARTVDDAVGAAQCTRSWLEELAHQDLGHEGDHAVAEALRNLRAVRNFLLRPGAAS